MERVGLFIYYWKRQQQKKILLLLLRLDSATNLISLISCMIYTALCTSNFFEWQQLIITIPLYYLAKNNFTNLVFRYFLYESIKFMNSK